jgi:hypothetical protein
VVLIVFVFIYQDGTILQWKKKLVSLGIVVLNYLDGNWVRRKKAINHCAPIRYKEAADILCLNDQAAKVAGSAVM